MKMLSVKKMVTGAVLVLAGIMMLSAYTGTGTVKAEETSETAVLSGTEKSTWTKKNGRYTVYQTASGKTYRIKNGILYKNGKKQSLKKYRYQTVKLGGKYFYVTKAGTVSRTAGWKKDKNGRYAYYVAKNGTVTKKITSGTYKVYKNGSFTKKTLKKNTAYKIGGRYFYTGTKGTVVRKTGWKKKNGTYAYYMAEDGTLTYRYAYDKGTKSYRLYRLTDTKKAVTKSKSVGAVTFTIKNGKVASYTVAGTIYQPSGKKLKATEENTTEEKTTEEATTESTSQTGTTETTGNKGTTDTTTETAGTTGTTHEDGTVHRWKCDYTAYKDAACTETGVNEVAAEKETRNVKMLIASGTDVYDWRVLCGGCLDLGYYYIWDEFKAHVEERCAAGDFSHGGFSAAEVVVNSTPDQYEYRDVEVITANAYDTWYYKYTCVDCGETMTGYVVGTYEGEPDPIVLHNYKMKVIKFTDSGRIINAVKDDVTESVYGCTVVLPGTEYNFEAWN